MKTYKITYVESLLHVFYVDAESEGDAAEEFERQMYDGDLDFSGGEAYDGSIESIEEETE